MGGTNIQITHHVTLCLFIYVVVCNCISSFTTASAQRINILPTDPAVCTGDNITFTCSLETTTNSKNQIKPVLSSESLVASSSTHLIDYGTAEITLFNVSRKHDHVAVCCILDNTDEICDMLTDASSILNVYPLPIEVQNFSCLVENYDRSLNCSWSYGTIYDRFKEPEVALLWKSGDSPWMHCPYLDIENGFCFWENTETDFTFREIQMIVSLEQTCGKSAESHFLTDTSKIVKPNPVVEFSSYVISSTCIEVKWQSADKTYPKRHTVKVSGRWKDNLEFQFNTTSITEQQTQTRRLCDLHPYTSYTVTVSTLPIGNQSGYNSDPKSVVAVTYTDKPASSPKVIQGGYHWHPRECEGNNKERRVCIFWKPLVEVEKNGKIESLPFKTNAVHGSRRQYQSNFDHDQTYGCLNDAPCNDSFNFTISARNVNGTSERWSSLSISSASSGMWQPAFYVEADIMNKLYFNLKPSETTKASSALVAWCHNHNGDCQSDSEVQWKKFSWGTEQVVVQLEFNENPQDFLYGVSAVYEEGSSGLEWQECVYSKHKEPSREPGNVVIANGPMDNSLLVSWDKLNCKPGEPYIVIYNVLYMNLEDGLQKLPKSDMLVIVSKTSAQTRDCGLETYWGTGPRFFIYIISANQCQETDSTQNTTALGEARLLLEDLVEDQTYVVQVRGVTKDGRYGPGSQPLSGIPLHYGFRSGTIIGLSLGIFAAVVTMVVACYCMIWRCRKEAMYKIEKAKEITVPEFDHYNSSPNEPNIDMPRESTVSMDTDSSVMLVDGIIRNSVSENYFETFGKEQYHVLCSSSPGLFSRNVDESKAHVVFRDISNETLAAVNHESNSIENNLASYNSVRYHSQKLVLSNASSKMHNDNCSHDNHAPRVVTSNTMDKMQDHDAGNSPSIVTHKSSDEIHEEHAVHTNKQTSDAANATYIDNTGNILTNKAPNGIHEENADHMPIIINSNAIREIHNDFGDNTANVATNSESISSYIICSFSATTNTSCDAQEDDYHVATVEMDSR